MGVFKMDRSGSKKVHLLATVHSVLYLVILVAVGTILLTAGEKSKSEKEKRELMKLPVLSPESVLSGKFMKDFSGYVTDQFPERERILELMDMVKNPFWVSDQGVKIVNFQNGAEAPGAVDDTTSGFDEGDVFDPNATGKMKNNLLIYDNKAYQLFGALPAFAKHYAKNVNKVFDLIGDLVKIYSMVFPSPAEFYVKGKYDSLSRSEKAFIDSLYSYLNPKIVRVDAYSELNRKKRDYLYFGTDHHWTARGAYQAYVAFCKSAGMKPKPLDTFKRKVKHDFVGSLYSYTRDPVLKENPDSVEYFISNTKNSVYFNYSNTFDAWQDGMLLNEKYNGASSYLVFTNGDVPVIKMITGVKDKRRILVIKESFGNAFVPFLINNFSEVYVADFRYFKFTIRQMLKTYKITDLLILNNSFSAATPFFTDRLVKMVDTPPGTFDINKELGKTSVKEKNKEVPKTTEKPAETPTTPDTTK